MPSDGSDAGGTSAPAGVYVHIPFCAARCSYCDFPTVAGRDTLIEPYLAALEREIRDLQPDAPDRVDTVFFGGGTPSRLEPRQVARVLRAVRSRFTLLPGSEVTLEANPESIDRERARGFRDAGITRLSLGVQSLDDAVLKGAGRAHDGDRARGAIAVAREAGFASVSVDLIAGLPGEDLARWDRTLETIVDLGPDHVSVYLLETDKDTPLSRGIATGRIGIADDDALAGAYETTVAVLEASGFPLYEISNFARPGHRSRHNLKYWTDAPFAGFGNGAHGYLGGARRANRPDVAGYIEEVAAGRTPVAGRDPYDPRRRLEEALFLGLRLADGVDADVLAARYGSDPRVLHREAWERAREAGLTLWDGARVRLTPAGRLRSNELFAEILT